MRRSFQRALLAAAVAAVGSSLAAQIRIPDIAYESAPGVLQGLPDDVYIV